MKIYQYQNKITNRLYVVTESDLNSKDNLVLLHEDLHNNGNAYPMKYISLKDLQENYICKGKLKRK
ncbi:MAG: hypothetical protein ACLUSV_00885 [Streptococcus sp.]